MIFSELYSVYYNTVAKIISSILKGKSDSATLQNIVRENAFGESIMSIIPSIKNGEWQIITPTLETALQQKPTMPLTNIQMMWLKAISSDARIGLFDIKFDLPDDIQPLFSKDDYYVFDKYSDGDPYDDEDYIRRFRIILSALKNKSMLKIGLINKSGREIFFRCVPQKLDYSEKDDKFRLMCTGSRYTSTVNLSKITYCEYYCGPNTVSPSEAEPIYDSVTLKVRNERNALERCMLHFAHFEKNARQINKVDYMLNIRYRRDDEAEMVIRILSFGPLVEVVKPEEFRDLIKEKLIRQKRCNLK